MWLFTNTAGFTHTLWILLIQIPLFKAHLARKGSINNDRDSQRHYQTKSNDMVPTTTELFLATLVFWTIQFAFETAATLTISIYTSTSHPAIRDLIALMRLAIWEALFRPLIATWLLYLALHTALEFILPAFYAICLYPVSTLQYTLLRARNLAAFIVPTLPPPPPRTTSHSQKHQISRHQRTRSQSLPTAISILSNRPHNIHLERTHSYPKSPKSPRALDWNLVVDLAAMKEMKETLGPPGGFGELGFCVQKDGVKFECMGPGTSFSLAFRVEGDEASGQRVETVVSNSSKTRKKKH